MKSPVTWAATPSESSQITSPAVVALTGLSYLFVGFSFSYLDRRFGAFGMEAVLWLVWAGLGFGAGTLNIGRQNSSGQTQWVVVGLLGGLLALMPGFLMYNLLRWTALTLMIVIGARAAILKTKRDCYLTLTVIFVVSFMVGTHGAADWTLWAYLGPAWIFGGLALAWDHASGTRLSRWTKAIMTLGFVLTCFSLAALLFFFAPRPPVLGFGFLPPGTDTPGLFNAPAGTGGDQGKGGNNTNRGVGIDTKGQNQNASRHPQLNQQWGSMLNAMRRSASDPAIPQWQRGFMMQTLDWAEALRKLLTSDKESSPNDAQAEQRMQQLEEYKQAISELNWLLIALLLVAAWFLWRYRYRVCLSLLLFVAGLLGKFYPAQSMRVTAHAIHVCMHIKGHRRQAGQSVREHWNSASDLAPLAKRWLGYAMELYCAMRFSGLPATPQHAASMRKAVSGACEIVLGRAPELTK